jgi:cold shock CspA family protein
MRGTMIWFNEEKDHGYISTETGERLYIPGTGFAGGERLKGRCAGTVVEFEVRAENGAREAGECVAVEEAAPRRARRRHASRRLA